MATNTLPRMEVWLSPALLHLYYTKGAVVVIIAVSYTHLDVYKGQPDYRSECICSIDGSAV